MDDGICRSTADVHLVGYISDSNPSVLLNQSMNPFNIARRWKSGRTAWAVFIKGAYSATSEPFHPLAHLSLCDIVFSVKVKLSLCFNWAPRHEGVLGEWRYSSTLFFGIGTTWGEWSVSRPGRFTPRGRAPVTHWIRGWVGPRAVLEAVVKTKIFIPRLKSNPRTPIVQPVAQYCTDWAILRSCTNILLWISEGLPPLTTKIQWQNTAQQWSNTKAEPTCLHCDCLSFTGRNCYPTRCRYLAQYTLYVMYAKAVRKITRILHTNCPYFLNSFRI
jgi:hypothetical protein